MIKINASNYVIDEDWQETSLLEYLRDGLGLMGTKYGCGIGQCGACTVHIDGYAVRSCQVKVSQVRAASITTIEGLADNDEVHTVQAAWLNHNVPQCGYCQAGQIMMASAYLDGLKAMPNRSDVRQQMNGNLCRCGTYERITDAVLEAAAIKFVGADHE